MYRKLGGGERELLLVQRKNQQQDNRYAPADDWLSLLESVCVNQGL